MNDQTKQALAHIAQALNDFAATLPQSARGPFVQATSQAMQTIDAAIQKAEAK